MRRSMPAGQLGVAPDQRPGASALSTGWGCVRPLSRSAARIVGSLMVLLLAGCAGLEQAPPRLPDRIDSPATGPALIAPGLDPSGRDVDDAANPVSPNRAGMAEPAPPLTVPTVPSVTRDAAPQAAAPMPKAPSSTAQPPSPPLPPSAQPAPAAKRSVPAQASVQASVQAPVQAALARPATTPPLDLQSLEARLKATQAIGVFTKLTLKNQIDDLLAQFRAYYRGQLKVTLAALRQSFDRLVLKVLALLQDADPPLAMAIESSRESIWGILSNPAKFAAV